MFITNARIITWEESNRILEDHAIYIKGDRILEISPSSEMLQHHPDAEPIDARGQYLLPGNICAHTHFYGAFARGLAIPGEAPHAFTEILEKLWWPLDKSLERDAIRSSALVCLIDAIRHGTTTVVDHHASPHAIDGSLDVLAEAVDQAGLRAVLCYEVSDRDGHAKAQAGIAENLRFLKKQSGASADCRIAATFGLHASLTLSDQTLDDCASAVDKAGWREKAGFHIHAAEAEDDQIDSLAKSGLRVIHRLHKHGILGPHSILAHAVHVDPGEIDLLAKTGTWVTHQPRSNMNNGVGTAPVEQMLAAGVKLGLGNDGFSNAMWEEWKAAYLLQKAYHQDPRRMSGDQVVRMAVYNNAALAGIFFPEAPLGRIVPGAYADLILVDYHPYTPLTPGNLPWHIIFGFHESMVTTTIVAGKILMKDRLLLTLDEEAIAKKALDLAPAVWKRYHGD